MLFTPPSWRKHLYCSILLFFSQVYFFRNFTMSDERPVTVRKSAPKRTSDGEDEWKICIVHNVRKPKTSCTKIKRAILPSIQFVSILFFDKSKLLPHYEWTKYAVMFPKILINKSTDTTGGACRPSQIRKV